MNVLLVEDEAPLADVLARNLRARGHGVVTRGTAEDAILSLAESWPDAMILDINLPDDSGWEVLRRLSSEDRRRLHVVVISAAPLSRKRLEEFRPAHALLKPFPIDALAHALQNDAALEEESDAWTT
jgi:DNA-binding response OmpR family regulator